MAYVLGESVFALLYCVIVIVAVIFSPFVTSLCYSFGCVEDIHMHRHVPISFFDSYSLSISVYVHPKYMYGTSFCKILQLFVLGSNGVGVAVVVVLVLYLCLSNKLNKMQQQQREHGHLL